MKFKSKVLLASLVLWQGLAAAQNPVQKLDQAYKVLTADPQTKYALTSLCVLDANTGQVIFGRNENIGMATASTLKTITAATAFGILGKDFKYQTRLAHSGTIHNGVLKGDLIIIGGGDPTLGSSRYSQSKENEILSQWVKAIKEAGINQIEGRVIGDDSAWGTSSMPLGWTWQDMGNYYGAAPSALSWRENQFDIHLKGGNGVGQPVTMVKVQPAMPYLQIVNELTTGPAGTGDNAYAFLPPLSSIAYLRGTWGLGIRKTGIAAALPDPAYDAAYRLQDTLKRLGIAKIKEVSTSRKLSAEKLPMPAITKELISINSPTLSQIIYWFNKKSINLYGENLMRTLAWKAGKPATTANGTAIAIDYWKGKGIDPNALNMADGSGLSPATRVTTYAMAKILYQSQQEPWFKEFYESLPEFNGMKIKSGSINDVSAFAGYYTNPAGKKYIVVINVNNYNGSGINKKIYKALDALK
ncbi:D-alanyl-D-alanine carboxypeptidase/D-alanyl-D-alanine endopeptidase [Pedobacter immunditicola]|uniref:D-alanyl-D-alanine carboxypeptidase/D-alanyl-D-alanine endopeptidase n=1 Tax=Pedobacter immunditicola TaxID=3133440 RepID=UPI0030A66FFE